MRAVAPPRHSACWAWSDIAASGIDPLRTLLPAPGALARARTRCRPPTPPAQRFAWVDDAVPRDRRERARARHAHRSHRPRAAASGRRRRSSSRAVMVLLFQSIFTWAVPAMDAIDGALRRARPLVSRDCAARGLAHRPLGRRRPRGRRRRSLVFLPQILILFTFIHLLEDVGYMARAAFVVDRVMGWVGPAGTQLRAAALVLRVRGPGHHGRAHHRVAARAPGHDPGRAVHDLLGAAAGLHAADRGVRPGDDACSVRSACRAW